MMIASVKVKNNFLPAARGVKNARTSSGASRKRARNSIFVFALAPIRFAQGSNSNSLRSVSTCSTRNLTLAKYACNCSTGNVQLCDGSRSLVEMTKTIAGVLSCDLIQ